MEGTAGALLGCGADHRSEWIGVLGRFTEGADLVDELGDVAEFLIHTGEAHVGDLVDVAEALHHAVSEGAGRNFTVELGFDGIDNVFDEHRDLFEIYGTFVTGGADGADEFVAVELLAATIAFDDDDVIAHDGFRGAIAMATFKAFAAAANAGAFLADAGIDDLVLD
jgi:hypothetical protein